MNAIEMKAASDYLAHCMAPTGMQYAGGSDRTGQRLYVDDTLGLKISVYLTKSTVVITNSKRQRWILKNVRDYADICRDLYKYV